jgi:transposase-like protein
LENIKRAGKYKGKYKTSQGYRCKDCGRFFVERDGFEGKHYPKHVIVQALHLYVEGYSLSKTRYFLWQHFGYSPSDSTILDWVKRYSGLLHRFERGLKPKIRGRMHLDEVFVRVRGRLYPVLQAVGSRTGYCHKSELERHRDIEAYERLFKHLKRRLDGQIRARFRRARQITEAA